MARETTLNFRIHASGRAKIEALAEAEERSLGDMTRILIAEALAARAKKVKLQLRYCQGAANELTRERDEARAEVAKAQAALRDCRTAFHEARAEIAQLRDQVEDFAEQYLYDGDNDRPVPGYQELIDLAKDRSVAR
jgi:chromosome segregation ATPase